MASNAFGNLFKITTWGESHGKAIGVVIDGCPAGLEIHDDEINAALTHRAPGKGPHVTPRAEADKAEILSGIFEGKTTGAPISIIIFNRDVDSSKYETVKHLLRPGHANYTYLEKYGLFDYRGGGRASARETACRVAAGAVAKKILLQHGVTVTAYLQQMGPIKAHYNFESQAALCAGIEQSAIFCPDITAEAAMIAYIESIKADGDSTGGVVEFIVTGVPAGWGDPVYEKLEANLAKAMLGLPASKGFEIGLGFNASAMQGSEHNDLFVNSQKKVYTETNCAGGILGGISSGMPIVGRVAFKPTSSIMCTQRTLTLKGEEATLQLPVNSRHDPCVAIRAVPVIEAMAALVLIDALLWRRLNRL